MKKSKKLFLILLILLNTIVLLGQVYPQGVPPFARIVNIFFLVANLIFIFSLIGRKTH